MIPLPQLLVELVLGLGAALCGANLVVLLQERRRRGSARAGPTSYRRAASARGRGPRSAPSMRRVWSNVLIGAAIAAWAAVTLAARA